MQATRTSVAMARREAPMCCRSLFAGFFWLCRDFASREFIEILSAIVIKPTSPFRERGDGFRKLGKGLERGVRARQRAALQGERRGRRTRTRRGSAHRKELVGMPRSPRRRLRAGGRRRPTFAAEPPLLNNASNSKRSSSAWEIALLSDQEVYEPEARLRFGSAAAPGPMAVPF